MSWSLPARVRDFARLRHGTALAAPARMRWGIVVIGLAGCIEGEEPDAVHNITPRACETGLASDQAFVISGSYELDRQERLRMEPPEFLLDGTTPIALTTEVGAYGELTLRPLQPLPPGEDFQLRMVEPGALAGVALPGLFPAAYSTRDVTELRSHRAIDGNIFLSFSRALSPAMASAISVNGAAVTSPPTYLDAPGHVVHLRVSSAATTVDVSIAPPALPAVQSVRVDATYTPPAANGCEQFD
jgi:hypothetical protein